MTELETYRFTVFTPCYNSSTFIHRVFRSLTCQEFKSFEWLIIDDCSTDNTLEVLEGFMKDANFEMRIIKNSKNQGLTRNIDHGVQLARGEFFIPLGHDDEIKCDALFELDRVWQIHGGEHLSGIWSNCVDQNGNRLGIKFPEAEYVSNLFDMFTSHLWRREYFPCTRTVLMAKYPLSQNQLRYVPEGLLWFRIALDYNTIFIDKITRVYYREPDNLSALTKRKRSQVADSVIYQNLTWINEYMPRLRKGYYFKLRTFLSLALHSIIAKNSKIDTIGSVWKLKSKILLSMMFLPAQIYYWVSSNDE